MRDLAVYRLSDNVRAMMLRLARRNIRGYSMFDIKDGTDVIHFIAFKSGRIINLNSCDGELPDSIRRLEGIKCD